MQLGLTQDKNYELYSITKALTAILAGDLIAEGKISRDSSVKEVVGAFRPDPLPAFQWDQLLLCEWNM